ncbi:D-alanyl-D-alanine carboxypeptidase [Enterocloster aldenensis]|uniref:D-alanyl-D-alanine carboxypeptidase family protein n=1 Tax=Enterocloster aldenensis TaxID=358742 RepID=UPI000E4A15DB|nr:D-alanyl-D-alanine carboxypeptidase [Enterocloster aldenensis]
MKRIAAILLSFTVLLVHPAATALGQEPDIAIPVGAVAADSELRTAVGGNAGAARAAASQAADSQAVDSQAVDSQAVDSQAVDSQAADSQAADGQAVDGQAGEERIGDTQAVEVPSADTQSAQAPSSDSQPAVQIAAPSAVLMEASTGQIIYEKGADEKRSPASVTKVMTLILIFDALQSGKINLTDEVVTSAHAKSMGGSQVFLEEGEKQTVETLIKCIVIASGNDASVAMAEYIGGTEEEFVRMMNERAAGLGMANTHFVDCCGLTESPDHLTTARDIAIMSRELINKYPQIHNYSTIWMENITHVTKQGTKEFGLSNTNKLLKMATNFKVTGLKTGSTSIAKYCLSATAEKDGVRLIATIMAAPDFKARFGDAQTLLNYGYANCKLYEDKEHVPLPQMPVTGGVEDEVGLAYEGVFSYLSLKGEDLGAIEKNLVLAESMPAPVEPGQKAGVLEYTLGGKKLGEVNVLTNGSVREAGYMDYLNRLVGAWKLNR